MDSFLQHDVQEFNLVLRDKLEMNTKAGHRASRINNGTGHEGRGAIQKLFFGKINQVFLD